MSECVFIFDQYLPIQGQWYHCQGSEEVGCHCPQSGTTLTSSPEGSPVWEEIKVLPKFGEHHFAAQYKGFLALHKQSIVRAKFTHNLDFSKLKTAW